MTPERAKEIWGQQRFGNISNLLTAEEKAEVNALWQTLPGNTCFMDAFFLFLHPEPLDTCYTYSEMRAASLHRLRGIKAE